MAKMTAKMMENIISNRSDVPVCIDGVVLEPFSWVMRTFEHTDSIKTLALDILGDCRPVVVVPEDIGDILVEECNQMNQSTMTAREHIIMLAACICAVPREKGNGISPIIDRINLDWIYPEDADHSSDSNSSE